MLPDAALYLRNIMEFAGYTTRDAVLRLRDAVEQRKMFDFAIEMADILEDKQKYFGIFASKPEKVRVLPGLEAVFKQFLDAVAASKCPSSRREVPMHSKSSKKEKSSITSVTCETLVEQMLQWCKNKGHDGQGKIKIEKSPPNKYYFTCICKERIVLAVTKNAVSLSNVQRHIKDVCWMAEKPPNPKKRRQCSTIEKFFPPESTSGRQGTVQSLSNLETIISITSISSSSASGLSSFEVTVNISDE